MNTVTCQKCGFNYEAPMHCVVPANCPRCFPSGTWAVKTVADLKQDQKDFPHIAQDIQVAIDHEEGMTSEQERHLFYNYKDFHDKYEKKYRAGQKAHGGDMWTMGAYQVLENMEEEVLDQWSYARQIRKCLDEIRDACESPCELGNFPSDQERIIRILEILNRQKDDGEKK